MTPPVIMVGIHLGIFTATDAAAAGPVYAILVATLHYRNVGGSAIVARKRLPRTKAAVGP